MPITQHILPTNHVLIGGKAKPLKAPKKEKKEMDEEDLAFREKQKAGAWAIFSHPVLDMALQRSKDLELNMRTSLQTS